VRAERHAAEPPCSSNPDQESSMFSQSTRMHLFLALALVGAGSTYLRASASAPPPQLSSLHVPRMIPAGTILPFAGDTVPAGYLLCDGNEVLRSAYPDLFDAIGPAWGSATGFTFTLPDMRGRFLRGVDGAAGNDPDRNARSASAPGGNVGNNVGSVQGDARRGISGTVAGSTSTVGNHTHGIEDYEDDHDEDDGWSGAAPGWADDANPNLVNPVVRHHTESAGSHNHSFSVGVTFAGDAETRPKNVYVNYIIKT
jgi:tail collar domain